MGDRISFQFVNGNEVSVAFFSHWDGKQLLHYVHDYFKELKKEILATTIERDANPHDFNPMAVNGPLNRLEPHTLMVDFIAWFIDKGNRVWSNYYLGKDGNDGDNSDNGNFLIDVNEEMANA